MRQIRHILFADRLRPSATVDVDGLRRQIAEAKFELGEPSRERRRGRAQQHVAEAQRELMQAVKDRDAVRAVLWPSDDDASEE